MIKIEKRSVNKTAFWIITIGTFALFMVLAFFFPYSGDDWAWGSQLGIDRLKTFYEDYNGRYLGNLLVTLLTRSKVLDAIVMALSYYGACWLCYKYAPGKKNIHLIFAVVLFFLMPRTIFMQSLVWTSGYANYVPSALLSLGYILMVKNITDDEIPQYSKWTPAVTFILGFSGALFIENIALFNICLGVAVVGYTFLKFKKVYAMQIAFLIGSVIGAVCMFTNGAYHNITSGEDAYRNVPGTLEQLIESCKIKGYMICEAVIIKNLFICGLTSILLVFLTIKFLKNSQSKKINAAATTALIVNVLSIFMLVCRNFLIYYSHHSGIDTFFKFLDYKRWQAVFVFAYIATLFIVVLLCVEKGKKFRILLPAYCVPVMVAPLLVVHPIGPRCFFAPYLFMMVFIVNLFAYLIQDVDFESVNYKALFCGFSVLAIIQAIIFVNIFFPIYKYDKKRNDFAKLQAANNERQIVVCTLPNSGYLWCSAPNVEPWGTRYKLFYGLESDVQLKVVTPAEMDEYIKEYNKEK